MTDILYTIAAYYAALCVLWVFYLAIMSLDRANREDKLTWVCKPFAYALLFIGLWVDLTVQIAATLPFFDPPRELTLSERLTRYKNQRTGWRYSTAVWFAKHFLDPFDPRGKHI
jgi:disulfide bond formation protein DsbB